MILMGKFGAPAAGTDEEADEIAQAYGDIPKLEEADILYSPANNNQEVPRLSAANKLTNAMIKGLA